MHTYLVAKAGQQRVHETLEIVLRHVGPLGVLGRQRPEELAAAEAHRLVRRARVQQQELDRPAENRRCLLSHFSADRTRPFARPRTSQYSRVQAEAKRFGNGTREHAVAVIRRSKSWGGGR